MYKYNEKERQVSSLSDKRAKHGIVTTKSGNLNVRVSPRSTAKQVSYQKSNSKFPQYAVSTSDHYGQLKKGTPVSWTEKNKGWIKLDRNMWVSEKYVTTKATINHYSNNNPILFTS